MVLSVKEVEEQSHLGCSYPGRCESGVGEVDVLLGHLPVRPLGLVFSEAYMLPLLSAVLGSRQHQDVIMEFMASRGGAFTATTADLVHVELNLD